MTAAEILASLAIILTQTENAHSVGAIKVMNLDGEEGKAMDRLTHRTPTGAVPARLALDFAWDMTDYEWNELKQIIELLATYENLGTIDTLTRLQRDYSDLRNELCLACGKYKEAHKRRCNGCRWGEKGEGNDLR